MGYERSFAGWKFSRAASPREKPGTGALIWPMRKAGLVMGMSLTSLPIFRKSLFEHDAFEWNRQQARVRDNQAGLPQALGNCPSGLAQPNPYDRAADRRQSNCQNLMRMPAVGLTVCATW